MEKKTKHTKQSAFSTFTLRATLFAFAIVGLLASCSEQEKPKPPVTKPTGQVAHAVLKPTEGNTAKGVVEFIQLEEGVKIVGDIEGVPKGGHGFHIHEYGDCSAPDASSAGGHYNPRNSLHGSPDDLPRHMGDLGNIVVGKGGKGRYESIDYMIALDGPDSIIGKSIIVHAHEDDFISQPTGNAGPRIACGVIVEGEVQK